MASNKFKVAVEITAIDNAGPRARAIFAGIGASAKLASKGVSSVFNSILSAKTAIAGLVAGYLGLRGAQAVVDWAKGTDETSKFAKEVGLSVEALTELEYAGGRIGASSETMRKSLRYLNRGIGDLVTGGGKLRSVFGKDAGGRSLLAALEAAPNTETAFDVALRAIERIPDAQRKATVAQALFGKGGVELIRVANAGGTEIRRMRQEAVAFGRATTKDGDNAEVFVDSLEAATMAVGGLKNRLGGALLPVLTPAVNKFSEWVRVNRDLIATRARGFIEGIGKAVDSLVTRGLPGVLRLIGTISRRWDEIVVGTKVVFGLWAGSKMIGGMQAMAASAALIATSMSAAAAAQTGATVGQSMAAKLAAGAGPWGTVAGAALATAYLYWLNHKRDKEIEDANQNAHNMNRQFDDRPYEAMFPAQRQRIEDEVVALRQKQGDDRPRGRILADAKNQDLISSRLRYWAKTREGIANVDEAQARARLIPESSEYSTSPFFNGPERTPVIDGEVKVEVQINGAPAGTRMKVRQKGRVNASGRVSRAVGGDDDGGDE